MSTEHRSNADPLRLESPARGLPDFERQWLDNYITGDESGFVNLYHRYRGPVYRYLAAHVPSDELPKLFIETWTAFLRNAGQVPHDITPGAAVFAEAHYLLMDYYRQIDRAMLLSFADGVVETIAAQQPVPTPEHHDLHAAHLNALPPAWRETLQVFLETGFDGESLGYALHVSRDTVRSRLKRAFAHWRKQWPDAEATTDTQRSTQFWIHRYRSYAQDEPLEYLDARVLKLADWQSRWWPQLKYFFHRYGLVLAAALLSGAGLFGYLWTTTEMPQYQLEVAEAPAAVVAAPPAAPLATPPTPAPAPSEPAVAMASSASAVAASAAASTAAASAARAKPALPKKKKTAKASAASAQAAVAPSEPPTEAPVAEPNPTPQEPPAATETPTTPPAEVVAPAN